MKQILQKTIYLFPLLFVFLASTALGAGWQPSKYTVTGLPNATVGGIISNLTMWVLGIFGFVAVIGFVISGILYLTAAGNVEQEKTAKNAMKMSIIGILVGLVGLVVITAVTSLLSASI